ncbi:hypothetical protein Ddye_026018 [Dipteronia dyeriana]|uniref:Uncharacterized protein n=1 Tax=Dipteronia dyeriana TaxID=168575 RepID=A0AAD9WQ34_9ROSI|nr:hypothetical protein Ddye_026018 [Dipteronia dyeriana]
MITDVASRISPENLGLLCTIFWRVWYILNLGVFEKDPNGCIGVSWWCKNFVAQFNSAKDSCGDGRRKQQRGKVPGWKPLGMGMLKANCDVVIDLNEQKIGIGIIIRNSPGLIMATSSQLVEAIS